jgi:hypothetical protein
MTRQIMSNDQVRLVREIPELALREGEVGTVRSSWYFPVVAFEVEFKRQASRDMARVLLLEDHVRSAASLS